MRPPSLQGRVVAIDLETTGLQFWRDSIFGVAISFLDGDDYYYDVRQDPWIIQWLRDELHGVKLWINHNIKFDVLFLRAAGVSIPLNRLQCTMLRAALINEHELAYDLDYLGKKYVKQGKTEGIYQDLADLFGGKPTKNAQMKNLQRAPVSLAARYAMQDTRLALLLWAWQEDEINRQDLWKVHGLEHRLLPVVVHMEWHGVRVDVNRAEEALEVVRDEIAIKQRELDEIAGFEVNPNPSTSIHKLFAPRQAEDGSWSLVDGTPVEPTGGGKPSINADALRRSKHPAAARILDLRQLKKMEDTFLEGHVLGHHHNGIIHCNFNQTKGDNERGTGTGRFSVDSPALQQIPKRNKRIASIVRSVFIPDEGMDWCCADWSGFEFRWFAHFSKSPKLIRAYVENPKADFHGMVALMTGLPRVMTPGIKGNAKQINLGLVFGMGEGKMASEMGLPWTWEEGRGGKKYMKAGPEAKAVFAQYHEAVPGVKEFLEKASAVAKDRGYIMSMWGRHIRFPFGQFTHKAGGLVLQSNAADALKWKMIQLHESGLPARLMLVVHDENNLSVGKGDRTTVAEIKRILEDFGPDTDMPMRVPVLTNPDVAENWWEASKD